MLLNCVVLEKILESPLDCKEIQPVHPKGNQSWIFNGSGDAEAEAPLLWLPDAKTRVIGKKPDARKDWGQEEKWVTEVETVGWNHRLTGYESEQTPGDSEGQESLACCNPWVAKSRTQLSNWTTTTISKTVWLYTSIFCISLGENNLCQITEKKTNFLINICSAGLKEFTNIVSC